MKKWLFTIICVLMLAAGLSATVGAEGDFQIEDGVLIGYFGPNVASDLVVPDGVKTIGRNAFQDYSNVKSITLPDSVTKIDMNAFRGCKGLTGFTIPGNVQYIGACAFRDCTGLTAIKIPDSVTTMMDRTFQGCTSLTTATMSNNMSVIRWGTFLDCSKLESIVIPVSIKAIKGYCFYDTKLTDIFYGGNSSDWQNVEKNNSDGSEKGLAGVNPTIHYNTVTIVVRVKSVSVKPTTTKVYVGKTVTLKATVKPSNAENKSVKWSSSNKKIATVDQDGTVHGVKKGTATITVKTSDGGKTAKCSVTVNGPTPVKKVTLNKKTATIDLNSKNKKLTLNATISPSNATNKKMKFTSSNTEVASVKASGLKVTVTARSVGKANIKVKTVDGSKTYTCKVTVKDTGLVTGITLSKKKATLKVNNKLKLTATLKPSDPRNKKIHWSSSDENVAIVDKKGNVTAIAPGKAKIIAETDDGGFKKKCTVTVK